jgi:hypothetical protein
MRYYLSTHIGLVRDRPDPETDSRTEMNGPPQKKKSPFPFWGTIALPASALWGIVLGVGAGLLFGNIMIGAAIGAALGISIGLGLFAAAFVIAASRT